MLCDELHPKTVYFCQTCTHFCQTCTHFCWTYTHFCQTHTHFGLTSTHFGLTCTHFGLTRRKVLLATETQHETENIDEICFQTSGVPAGCTTRDVQPMTNVNVP